MISDFYSFGDIFNANIEINLCRYIKIITKDINNRININCKTRILSFSLESNFSYFY